jgi:protein-S-isoprenylcysteine O-methyltransferase Ste14
MSLFFEQRTGAQLILGATAAIAVAAESWATYAGDTGGDEPRWRRALRSGYATVVVKNRRGGATSDKGTKNILIGGTILGLLVMVWVAKNFPGARVAANDWFGVFVGASLALVGIGLRVWAVRTLGRFFEREVVVDPEQPLVRTGPYRWVRHPAYAGNLLTWFGVGVAIGSWLGAFLGTAVILLAHLPRIRVEEGALRRAFGATYDREASKSRLVPGVW